MVFSCRMIRVHLNSVHATQRVKKLREREEEKPLSLSELTEEEGVWTQIRQQQKTMYIPFLVKDYPQMDASCAGFTV
jgi:hypothetical protein